ncbi:MAG: hypothetical protein HYZ23_01625 [Chloroflexi bacterium]|nr:hypothetical protein [Chloroflexota bacterium]
MNLRCIYCQTPFTLSRAEMLSAIMLMNEKGMNHYDAHCPRCRRANSISRQRMELFFPNWQEAAKKQASAPPPPERVVPASAFLKTEPVSKAMKAAVEKQAVKKAPAKKPATTKVKPAAKKPAATKTTAKKKK